MKKRNSLVALLMAVALFVGTLPGCGKSTGSESNAKAEKKDTLVVAVSADGQDQNPHGSDNRSATRVKAQVYESLFFLTQDNQLKPCLATDYSWEDETTAIIKLRKGVKFHCGGEMKAEDVLFSLERVSESGQAAIVEKIDFEKSEVIDDYTVRIVTKEPFAPLMTNLSYIATAIFSKKGYEEAKGDWSKSIGTGPYIWGDWVTGSRQTLNAFEDYWDKVGFKRIEFKVIPEATNRVIELETGACDLAYDVSAVDIERIEASEDIIMSRWLTNDVIILGYNTQIEPLNDPRVRKAIAMGFDRKVVWEVAYEKTGGIPTGFFEEHVPGAMSDIPLPGHDVAGAKELLAQAGYPDGFEISIVTNTSSERMAIAEYLQNSLKDIGITLTINAMDSATVNDTLTVARTFELYMWSIFPATGDIDYALRVYHSDTPLSLNIMGYSNPEYDSLVDEASAEMDEAKRLELQRKAQEILYKDMPVDPLIVRERLYAHSNSIEGFTDGSSSIPILKFVQPK